MDKIKRFIDCYVPTEDCNLRCHYCYLTNLEEFSHKTVRIEKSPQFIRRALSKERLGGTCMFNFCAGGETLLYRELIDVVKEILKEGHYVMIVTNGTISDRFNEFKNFSSELLSRLFFKFSFHFLEIKRLNLMNVFLNKIKKIKKYGASFTVEITPNDELIPYIDEIKDLCMKKIGALPHITVARDERGEIPILTKLSKEDYIKTWKIFDSELFNFKMRIWGEKRKEFCYAGDWSFVLNIASGDIKQCYRGFQIQNIYKDVNEPIKKLAVGNCCVEPHCFNGHAFLSFGDIVDLETPNFLELRNRIPENDREWVIDKTKEFMTLKLNEINKEYTNSQKKLTNFKNKIKSKEYKVKKIIKGILKYNEK